MDERERERWGELDAGVNRGEGRRRVEVCASAVQPAGSAVVSVSIAFAFGGVRSNLHGEVRPWREAMEGKMPRWDGTS